MSRLQQRFQATKNQWTQRLEDFTIRMNLSSHGPASSSTTLTLLPLTPFRVLLQLFAYETDVLPQLDLVFEKDDGIALTFYVPQLLSFLLHGAYHNAPDLERWILGKCKENIYFAHQCFWFLRAWCLEGSHAEQKGLQQQHQQQQQQHPPMNMSSRNSSFSSLLGGENANPLTPNHKYPPEERSAMEALLKRVVQCGQVSAQKLHELAECVFPSGGPLMATDEEGFVSLQILPLGSHNSYGRWISAHESRIDLSLHQPPRFCVRARENRTITSASTRTSIMYSCMHPTFSIRC
jgi:hypothetical protein